MIIIECKNHKEQEEINNWLFEILGGSISSANFDTDLPTTDQKVAAALKQLSKEWNKEVEDDKQQEEEERRKKAVMEDPYNRDHHYDRP